MKSKRIVNHFTDKEKKSIVQEYLTNKFSVKELQLKYNFGGNSSIQRWMIKFGLGKTSLVKISSKPVVMIIPPISLDDLNAYKKRIKELEQLLEDEKLRTFMLNSMIDIAEDQLKIPVRKKFGAK